MNNAYEAVFFDMGQTLVWFSPSMEEIALQAWQAAGLSITMEQLQKALYTVWKKIYRDAATATFPATREYDEKVWYEREREIMRLLGSDDETTFKAYLAYLKDIYNTPGTIRIYDDVLPTLTKLKERGYRLGIISNWNWTLVERCQQVGLDPYFEVIMASAYAGCNKPHPRIFQQALERMGVPAERAVHIGDQYEVDVLGAQAAGMAAMLLDRERKVKEAGCPVIYDLWSLPDQLAK